MGRRPQKTERTLSRPRLLTGKSLTLFVDVHIQADSKRTANKVTFLWDGSRNTRNTKGWLEFCKTVVGSAIWWWTVRVTTSARSGWILSLLTSRRRTTPGSASQTSSSSRVAVRFPRYAAWTMGNTVRNNIWRSSHAVSKAMLPWPDLDALIVGLVSPNPRQPVNIWPWPTSCVTGCAWYQQE